MAMKAWETIERDLLEFPIGGKTYTVPEMSYQAMLTLERAKKGEATHLDGLPAEETWRLVMGSAWDEMVADDVPVEALMRAGLASLAFFEFGRETAESVWETGVDPKALAAAIEAMQERAAKPASKRSPSTAAASSTPRRASTSGTTSRRATQPAKSKTTARKAR